MPVETIANRDFTDGKCEKSRGPWLRLIKSLDLRCGTQAFFLPRSFDWPKLLAAASWCTAIFSGAVAH
jgi:hypothetical protein